MFVKIIKETENEALATVKHLFDYKNKYKIKIKNDKSKKMKIKNYKNKNKKIKNNN